MKLLKNAIYGAVDKLTLGRGVPRSYSGERILLPSRWCRYFAADYEPETFRFLRETLQCGDTFLDIGAHIGLFSVVAARLVGKSGKVISFEPTPFTRRVLDQVVRLNRCSEIVEISGDAVSSTDGTTTFFDTGDTISVMNSLVKTEFSKEGIQVATRTVDSIVREKGLVVSSMKIDVEGAELELLRGAVETLRSMRPSMRLSLHPRFISNTEAAMQEIWTILETNGYAVILGGKPITKDRFCANKEQFEVNALQLDFDSQPY